LVGMKYLLEMLITAERFLVIPQGTTRVNGLFR
ncbi:hypothetical protein UCY_00321, partial [Enterococcus faecalis EnGen0252]